MVAIDFGTFLMYFMIVEDVGLGIFALYYLIFKDRERHFFLFFDTDKSCSMMARKVEDGFALFKKKLFYVDKAIPLMFFRSFGFQNPLLFLKWNDAIPVDVVRKTVSPYLNETKITEITNTDITLDKELMEKIQADPKFKKMLSDHQKLINKIPEEISDLEKQVYHKLMQRNKKMQESYKLRKTLTPEVLKDVIDSKIASNLLKPTTAIDMIMYIIIGLIVGFLLCIALITTGILPIKV
jgi:hypothetical protein